MARSRSGRTAPSTSGVRVTPALGVEHNVAPQISVESKRKTHNPLK